MIQIDKSKTGRKKGKIYIGKNIARIRKSCPSRLKYSGKG